MAVDEAVRMFEVINTSLGTEKQGTPKSTHKQETPGQQEESEEVDNSVEIELMIQTTDAEEEKSVNENDF